MTYSFTGANNGAFSINASTGQISVADKAKLIALGGQAILTVQATDSIAPTLPTAANITVNINRPPVLNDVTFGVLSTIAAGDTVGTNAANDADIVQALSYSIIAGNESGAFAINSSTGTITVANKAAFDTLFFPKSLALEVRDNGSPQGADTALVTVARNFPPVVNDQSFIVPTTGQLGLVIGTVVTSNAESAQQLTYSLTTGNESGALAIDATGKLTIANKTAFDALPTSPTFTVVIQDNGTPQGSDTAIISLILNTPPVINNQTFVAPSTVSLGTEIGVVAAFDAEAANGQTLAFKFNSGNETGAFAIETPSGKLTVANVDAFNSLSLPHVLTVQVQDSVSPLITRSATITITGNHAPVVNDQSFEIPLNATATTPIGTVVVMDIDANQTKSFSFVGGAGVDAFVIDPATGVIKLKSDGALAGLSLPVALIVQVFDSGTPQKSDTAIFTLTGIGNHPPVLQPTTFTVPPTGETLGTLIATDPDIGQVLTYQLLPGVASGTVALGPTTGILEITNRAAFDGLTFPVKLLVAVHDSGVPEASTTAVVTIVRSPTTALSVIHFDAQTFTVPTTVQAGAVLGTVFAFGKEMNPGDEPPLLRFSSNSAAFPIDPLTGALTSTSALAAAGSSTIQITVSDLSNPALSVTRPVTINVVSTVNHLPASQNLEIALDENSSARTEVGKVVANPADPGEKLTFTIVETSVPRAFTIDSKTGTITINDDSLLDYEQRRVIYLKVRVTDDGKSAATSATANAKPLSTFVTVTIRLQNVDDDSFLFETRDDSRTYLVGNEPVRLDPEAIFRTGTLTPAFDNVTLTASVSFPAERPRRDSLVVVSDKPGPGNISVTGKSILYGNTVIGMFEGGRGKLPNLTITFNPSASEVSIQALLRRIGFKTGGPAGERHVDLAFSSIPGIAGTPPVKTQTVNVIK